MYDMLLLIANNEPISTTLVLSLRVTHQGK